MRNHVILSITVGYVAYHLMDDWFYACVLGFGCFIVPFIGAYYDADKDKK